MSNNPVIKYVSQSDIDKAKWDNCIRKADNGVIYAYSFYLDHMSLHWGALVLGDYDMVMPLPWNSKYGIHYIYQPFLTAQLGVFGNQITPQLLNEFIKAIPSKFKLVELPLNSGNLPGAWPDLVMRDNFILDLNRPYPQLFESYNENIKRNIKKAQQAGCTMEKGFDVEKVISLALQQMKVYDKESSNNVTRFRKLYEFLHSREMATTYGVVSEKNELLASCVFFFSHHRAYYILVGNHSNGKNIGASHALIDSFIKDHTGKNILLDFEGSDIPGLALFYSGFGAKEEKYPALRLNRLPFYLKWLKK